MNYKLEKFWNKYSDGVLPIDPFMNYKLEKFWNINRLEKAILEINEL